MSTNACPVPATSRKLTDSHPLDAKVPLVFLPVYIETRFVDLAGGGSELWVRIYPDQISINAHEPELTQQEISDGQTYWNTLWSLGKSASAANRRAPWATLGAKYGAQRAAWIACQMTPSNVEQQPGNAAPTASLQLAFGGSSMTFACSRPGATGNQVQIAVDASSPREKVVIVAGDLVTIYAKWDGNLHSTTELAAYFPSSETASGGAIAATVFGSAQPLSQKPPTYLADGVDPSPLPAFPSPAARASSWEKPPIADALPDAWTVVLISKTQRTTVQSQKPVQLDLATGMDPHATAFPPGSPVDGGLQWLVNFEEAVNTGMAVKIPLNSDQRANGFDRIIVYGLRSRDADPSGTLRDLLDAHHYTDGFALVPQGAPTNNTTDASSAYSRKDPDYATSFAVERNGPLIQGPQAQPYADGNRFATLMGFDPARMVNVQYSERTGSRNGTDMLTVLWPSTLGYFLSQLMTPGFPDAWIDPARKYALSYAIPRGSIPAFRVGRTPYGVLPATALSRYKLNDDQGPAIEQFVVQSLLHLWPTWLQSASHAPHLQRGGDPDTQLSLILGMDASANSFRGRQVLGNEFLWNYMEFIGMRPTERGTWWNEQNAPGRSLLNSFGFHDWNPRVIQLSPASASFPIEFSNVQPGVLSETDPLTADAVLGVNGQGQQVNGNYIQWITQASVKDLQAENYPGPKPTALLYDILRLSAILVYGKLATNAEIGAGRLTLDQTREQELIGMGGMQRAGTGAIGVREAISNEPLGTWDVLARPSIPDSKLSWGDYLVRLNTTNDSPFAELNEFRNSLKNLAKLPTAELDRLLTETLDACSHRLDVWATAVATAILTRTRDASGIAGVNLASYGWVEDVRPAAKRPSVQGNELAPIKKLDALRSKAGVAGTPQAVLQPQPDNGGFIYAPSQDQAAVAAILRSGYMNHQGTNDEDALSIDLSSERVRGALMLLEGVRQGQSLNAILGFLFEAGLHDAKLQKYIQPFRDKFPMAANQASPNDPVTIGMAVSNVVDGLALKTAWDAHQLDVGQNWGTNLPSGSQAGDQNSVTAILQTIDSYADALGDLSIAETVFQTVRGNFERGGGLLGAVSKGQRPPDPEVLNTRRGGIDITHRAALLFSGSPPANVWTGAAPRARGKAEPWLDAWLSHVLPDPANGVQGCTISYHDATGDHSKSVNLSQLGLTPLDCIAMAENSTNAAQRSELEYRILYAAAVPANADSNSITIAYAPTTDNALSIPDLLYAWKSLRLLLNGARPLTSQDFALPAKKVANSNESDVLAALRPRAASALNQLKTDLDSLNNAMTGTGLPATMLACSFYGVPGSVPFSNDPTDARLAAQAKFVLETLTDRYTKCDSLINGPSPSVADLVTAIATMLGKEFTLLPPVVLSTSDLQAVQSAFQQSDSLIADDPVAPARWIAQLSYVRPAVARLDDALGIIEIAGGTGAKAPAFRLAQLPVQNPDQWLALPWKPDKPPTTGRVALACFTAGDPTASTSFAGMMIDEWLDRVPAPDATAAVAFHYSEPNARPPQALLLGVCPDNRKSWDDDLVTALLEETLELAKIRTLDLYSLQRVGQILPALHFPLNLRGASPSVNFGKGKERSNVVKAPG